MKSRRRSMLDRLAHFLNHAACAMDQFNRFIQACDYEMSIVARPVDLSERVVHEARLRFFSWGI